MRGTYRFRPGQGLEGDRALLNHLHGERGEVLRVADPKAESWHLSFVDPNLEGGGGRVGQREVREWSMGVGREGAVRKRAVGGRGSQGVRKGAVRDGVVRKGAVR